MVSGASLKILVNAVWCSFCKLWFWAIEQGYALGCGCLVILTGSSLLSHSWSSAFKNPRRQHPKRQAHKMMGEVIVGTFIFIYSRYITLGRLSIMWLCKCIHIHISWITPSSYTQTHTHPSFEVRIWSLYQTWVGFLLVNNISDTKSGTYFLALVMKWTSLQHRAIYISVDL